MRNIKIRKRLVLLVMSVALSMPIVVSAQGGLFQRGEWLWVQKDGSTALFTNQAFGDPLDGSDVTNETFGNPTEGVDVTNQTFGEDAPLGSGLFTLLLAGAGYAVMKSNKRNNKNKKENIK